MLIEVLIGFVAAMPLGFVAELYPKIMIAALIGFMLVLIAAIFFTEATATFEIGIVVGAFIGSNVGHRIARRTFPERSQFTV